MAYPAPDQDYADMTLSPLTVVGGQAAIDQHGGATALLDGINDDIEITGQLMAETNEFTWAMWFKVTSDGKLMTERNASVLNGINFFLASGILIFDIQSTSSDTTRIEGAGDYRDDAWHLSILSADGNTQFLMVDGAVVDSTPQISGGGFNAPFTTTARTQQGIGSNGSGAFLAGTPSRLRIWDSVALSEAQALDYHNAEVGGGQEGSFPPFFSESIYNPAFTGPFTQ